MNGSLVDIVRRYWVFVAIIGFVIAFSSQLQAMWYAPQEQEAQWEKTQEQFQQTYKAQQDYYTQQQVYQERWENRWGQQEKVNQQYYEWLRSLN